MAEEKGMDEKNRCLGLGRERSLGGGGRKLPFPQEAADLVKAEEPLSVSSYPSTHLPLPSLPNPKECATIKEHFQKQTPMSFFKRLNVNPLSTGLVRQR